MKIDLYTKVILTGILICLCLIAFRDTPFETQALANEQQSAEPMHVYIAGCVNDVGGRSIPLPVKVTNWR